MRTTNRTKGPGSVVAGMSDRERTADGTFRETVTLDAVLGVFDDVRGPVVTSSDVSDALGCSTEAARQKLATLYDRGEVDKRKTGRTVVYWQTAGERITPDERAVESHAERARERDATRPEEPEDHRDATPTRADSDDLADALDALDTTEERRAAVRACVAYLREHGEGQKSDFLDAVYPDHSAGYGSGGGWWNKIGKEYLQTVAEEYDPLTPPPGEGSHTWRYVTDDGDTVEDAGSGVYDPTEEF